MRIRKGRLARGPNASSASTASDPDMDISQQLELVSNVKQKIYASSEAMEQRCHSDHVAEGSDCGVQEKAPLALLEKLQISSTHGVLIRSPRPYMNLDEFVTSLARKNCFPADNDDQDGQIIHSDLHNVVTTGESSSLIDNFSVQSTDESQEFGRLFGGGVSSGSAEGALRGDVAAVQTSLRLAMSSVSAHSHKQSANPRTSTTTSVELEPTEEEMEAAAQADQTMKSSTESMEKSEEKRWSGRHTRVSSSTGRKRGRLPPLPAGFHDEQTDDNTAQDESSDVSVQQQAESRRAKRKRTQSLVSARVSVSSSTLAIDIAHGSETRKPKLGQRGGRKPASKQRASSSSRSGRPKKLKYLKQENVEELGNQCNRRDGKGWTCPLLAKPGYQLCDHHLDKLRCKPGSRSKYNKTNKKVA